MGQSQVGQGLIGEFIGNDVSCGVVPHEDSAWNKNRIYITIHDLHLHVPAKVRESVWASAGADSIASFG